jgi:ornithine cyclodeaminase/alanine dehydrogenase-like protein (mu-crystallin family)
MELDEDVYRRAELIVANSKVHEWNVLEIEDAWPIVRLARAGVLDWERVPELGQVIAGKIPRPTGISVYRDARGGFDDVALAVRAYERAVALGRGTDWDPE